MISDLLSKGATIKSPVPRVLSVGTRGYLRGLEPNTTSAPCPCWAGPDRQLKGWVDRITSQLVVGTHLIVAIKGVVSCFEIHTGVLEWSVSPAPLASGLVVGDMVQLARIDGCQSAIVCAGNGSVLRLEVADGSFALLHTVSAIASRPEALALSYHENTGTLLVGCLGTVTCVQSGAVVWNCGLPRTGYGEMTLLRVGASVIVGGNGIVSKLAVGTGSIEAQIKLPRTGYVPVALLSNHDGSLIYAASWGSVFCLSMSDLAVVWRNDLPGLGYALAHTLRLKDDSLYVAASGRAIALSAQSGAHIWTSASSVASKLAMTTAILFGESLIVAANGAIKCFALSDGAEQWADDLRGLKYGRISLACETDFTDCNSSSTLLQAVVRDRKNWNKGSAWSL